MDLYESDRLHTVHGVARVGHDLATKPPPKVNFNSRGLSTTVAGPLVYPIMQAVLTHKAFKRQLLQQFPTSDFAGAVLST